VRHRPLGDQVGRHQLVGAETADRQQRPVDRQRRDDGVDARAVGQPGVDHRRGLIDAAADLADDLVDDPHQVAVVFEGDAGQLELALALDVDLVVAVDEDVGDGRLLQQRLERPQAENLVEHLAAI
jgi:hypothetical protein